MPRNLIIGARVIELKEDSFEHKTWIRQGDGKIADLVEHKPDISNVQFVCR